MKRIITFSFISFMLLIYLVAPANTLNYTVSSIGDGKATDINESNTIIGSTRYDNYHCNSWVWNKADGRKILPFPSGDTIVMANGINDSGVIVGETGYSVACRWNLDGTVVYLPTNDNFYGNASAINNSGNIAGQSLAIDSSAISHSLYWTPDLIEHQLIYDSGASDINDLNELAITIRANMLSTAHAAFYDSHGNLTIIDSSKTWSFSYALNNKSNVVGSMCNYLSNDNHPFSWSLTKGLQILSTLSSYKYGIACDINNKGQIVGVSYNTTNGSITDGHATLWQPDGTVVDLGSLNGMKYSQASAINEIGMIVGYSTDDYGNNNATTCATLWAPVPEPSPLLALLCGIGSLGGLIIRKKQ